ncbi:hypothetical protein ACTXT7_009712 [Hymenolepis weldensis]
MRSTRFIQSVCAYVVTTCPNTCLVSDPSSVILTTRHEPKEEFGHCLNELSKYTSLLNLFATFEIKHLEQQRAWLNLVQSIYPGALGVPCCRVSAHTP